MGLCTTEKAEAVNQN